MTGNDDEDRVVFALSSSRTDEDFLDELMDELDMFGEDNWDILAWVRNNTTRIVIHAPYLFRLIVNSQHLELKIHPVGQVMTGMEDSRNEWLVPRNKEGENDQAARSMVQRWSREMYSVEGLSAPAPRPAAAKSTPEPKIKAAPKTEAPSPDPEPEQVDTSPEVDLESSYPDDSERPPKPTEEFERNDAKDRIKELFGISKLQDEEGNPIKMFSMSSDSDS